MTQPNANPNDEARREYARLVNQLGVPQAEVADRLGVARETLNRRLNGRHSRIIRENVLAVKQLLHEDFQNLL